MSRGNAICLGLAVLIGFILHLIPVLQSRWVVGDGGLFWNAAKAIADNHFILPRTIPYPTLTPDIPFCYPPLAFYLAAIFYSFGVGLDIVFKWLPFGFSLFLILCVWNFANTLFKGSVAAGATALLWSASFLGFSWHIQGGGLPRALGMCFALVAMDAALRLWRDDETRCFWWVVAFLALAVATHLERFQMGVIGTAALWLCYGRNFRTAAQFVGILLLAACFTLPWWGVCVARFGVAPFLSASRAVQYQPLTLLHFFPVLVTLLCLRKKLAFVPLWALLIVLLEPRSSFIFLTVPISLSLGVAIETCVFSSWSPRVIIGVRFSLASLLLLCFVLDTFSQLPTIESLSPGHRDAMSWVAQHTSATSSFLVLPTHAWARDTVSEWFPTLTQRRSLATVQGAEWLGAGVFNAREAQQTKLMRCSSWRDVEDWSQLNNLRYEWVFLPLHATTSLPELNRHLRIWNQDLRRLPQWNVVYSNRDVAVFHHMK